MSGRSRPAPARVARRASTVALLTIACALLLPLRGDAHGVSGIDALFLQGISGAAIGPLMYLGAKHMVTGYDHLAFLVGVIFFLYRVKDIVLYVSLFTLGHSITLLAGVLGGIHANSYLVDAVIGFSVVYKALRQHGAVPAVLRLSAGHPRCRAAVRPVSRLRARDEAAGLLALAATGWWPTSSASTSAWNRAGGCADGGARRC